MLHVAAHLSARWFEVGPGVSLWYPPTGLALALLIIVGPRCAPVVFFANALGAVITPGIHAWWQPWLFPVVITSTLAGVATLVRRFHGDTLLPGNPRETATFALVTVGGPALAALTGTATAVLLGITPASEWMSTAVGWWVGDASGVLTILPVAMVFASSWLGATSAQSYRIRWDFSNFAGFALKINLLLAVLAATTFLDPEFTYKAYYLAFLPLVWIGLRHGLPGAAAATLVITLGSILALQLADTSNASLISFLLFELTVSVVGIGLGVTVTRRNAAERKLVASEARLERVLTGSHLGIWDWNVTTGSVTYNERCADLLDMEPATLVATEPTWQEFAHPADRPGMAAALAAHIEGRANLYEVDFRVRTRTGAWRWIHTRGSIVARDANGLASVISGTHRDITARREAEDESRRLHQIIEVTTDFVLTTDHDRRITHANAAFLRLLGTPALNKLRGRPMGDILPAASLEILERDAIPAALQSHSWHGELTLRDEKNRELPVSLVLLVQHVDGGFHSLCFSMRDLTSQKAAETERMENERRMQQLQRTESLGVLAGGVAHDFNNLLTTMLGNANLARLDAPRGTILHELLGQIETAATRAGELCQQMLAYAGRAPVQFTDVDLTALIEETRQLLLVSIGHRIEVELELTHPLPPVRAAAVQLQQVIMNLAINASHAIGDRAGRIVIRTSARRFEAEELSRSTLTRPLAPGGYVVLEIEDNGCGMTPEIRSRIFEPFFTTKFIGHGLGLAAVHGIINSHQGAVDVTSFVDKGTTFRILLPAQHTTVIPAEPEHPDHEDDRRSGLALIIDDEPGVRRIAVRLLQSLGFETIDACNGGEGLELFRIHVDELRLVLLDLTMPRIDGGRTFVEMQRIRASVPVIIMSGFSERVTLEHFSGSRPSGYLSKPFDRTGLQAVLKSAMSAQLSPAACMD